MHTNLEVEQKYVVEDVDGLRKHLAEQGFEKVDSEQNCDIYFRHPCRDLKGTDEAFRLRSVNEDCYVTYKGKRLPGPVKARPEIELSINTGERESWLAMLGHLGFVPLPEVNKRRDNYARNSARESDHPRIKVMLDDVQGLGSFAELELIVTDARKVDVAAERIQQLAANLGLVTVQPRSYLSLVLEQVGGE